MTGRSFKKCSITLALDESENADLSIGGARRLRNAICKESI